MQELDNDGYPWICLFVAPILLVLTSILAQQSNLFLVKAGVYSTEQRLRSRDNDDGEILHHNNARSNRKGTATYEGTKQSHIQPT